MPLDKSTVTLEEVISRLEKLEEISHKNILELPEIPALALSDTVMVVTETDYTGKASLEKLMQYLNENLKNFICWKPVVTTSTLSWERSSNDQSPGSINFSDIIFPMASESTNGMITKEDFCKLRAIDSENIVYLNKLNEELGKKAPTIHYHEQYQLKAEMPSKLSQFENDTNFITVAAIPTKLSAFDNDTSYLTAESAPSVGNDQRGFMTPDLLSILNKINEDYIKSSDLENAKDEIVFNLPTKLSEFYNDMQYVTKSNLLESFGEMGVINLINDAQFRYANENFAWKIYNGNIESMEDDNYGSIGKITFTDSTSVLSNTISASLGSDYLISFVAKASVSATLKIAYGGVEKTVSVSEAYKRFKVKIIRDTSSYSHDISFSFDNSTNEEIILYMTNVKVERGSIISDFSYSYNDINKLSDHATENKYGLVKPDGVSLIIDEETGALKINMYSIIGPVLNDEKPSYEATFTSRHITDLLSEKADLVDGKVPSSQLPSYVDDVVEGVMSADNTVFVIDPDQNSYGDPSKGKIYLDRVTNIGYRWTGSGYMSIGEKYVHPSTSGFNHIPAGGMTGQVVGWQDDGIGKWVSLIYMSDTQCLSASAWGSDKSQTVKMNIDISCANMVQVIGSSMETWTVCQVVAVEETSNGITFKCSKVPNQDLYFAVLSMNLSQKTTDAGSVTGVITMKSNIEIEEPEYGQIVDTSDSIS